MASSSITRLPLYLHSNINQNRGFSFLIFQNSLKPFSLNPVHPPKTLCIQPKLHHLAAIQTSNSAPTNCFLTPQENISKFLSEKLVILLLGSFVFLGGLGVRPPAAAAAQPFRESSEVEGAQSVGSDEEMMYKKLLQKNPRDVEALKMIVNVLMKKGKIKEAVEFIEWLIEIQPREVEWRLLQAFCYDMLGELSKAKRLFKEVLKQKPLLLRALHGLAMVMHKNLEGPAVFTMLNSALKVARREKRVNEERNIKILIAQMYIVKGELEEALEKFQNLVQENPRDFRPYLCQGIVYSLLDKKKEAEEQFEIYQSLVPEEFPGRGFLDDVMLAAKTESKEQLEKEFRAQY